jgi:TetR/AcrR family transcriptional regulator, mexJK operon transcriptional repressor
MPKPTTPPANSAPTGARAERNRHVIVSAAREAFLSEGYGAGMDAIAARAGVSKVTVYNHFGSKEALFTAVIGDALDDALGSTLAEAQVRLTETDDVRDALVAIARVWVRGVADPSVLALRNLVAGELRRFPELGRAWQQNGPGRFFPMLAEVFERFAERGELEVPDRDVAVIQLFALTLYPHLVYSSYGDRLEPKLAEKLITNGVDLFLSHYATPVGYARRERRGE